MVEYHSKYSMYRCSPYVEYLTHLKKLCLPFANIVEDRLIGTTNIIIHRSYGSYSMLQPWKLGRRESFYFLFQRLGTWI